MNAPTSLRALTDRIWVAEHGQVLGGGLNFPTRMTVIQLRDHSLWIHSAVPIPDSLARELDELGDVQHIVVPNLFHHLYVSETLSRWPTASLYGPETLAQKRSDLPPAMLAGQGAASWEDEIEALPVRGAPRISETAFFHKNSGTLLVTDLLFNFDSGRGLQQKLALWLFGTGGGIRQSRVWLLFVRNRAEHVASCRKILAKPIQRLLPCHGAICETTARDLAAGMRVSLSARERATYA
ncbi:MAG: DUF4336 domain-containing protein [Spirochaetales bacterium]|nr:DUF4336 domain-containing protein [Leptospiraceae bacterium]MCP5482952.1 DUF4336 domain-containing protein [Spirochaetales bacterium]MCP5484867.1 DUF4336 domain-containing protein [Spirochaetales bacterium]